MEDATIDAVSHGFPPGNETLYLEMGHSNEKVWAK